MPNNLADRYNEIAAVSAASNLTETLSAMAMEPSGKRFTKSRAEAHNRWTQLAELATARARAAIAGITVQRKRTKPTVTVKEMPVAPHETPAGNS